MVKNKPLVVESNEKKITIAYQSGRHNRRNLSISYVENTKPVHCYVIKITWDKATGNCEMLSWLKDPFQMIYSFIN